VTPVPAAINPHWVIRVPGLPPVNCGTDGARARDLFEGARDRAKLNGGSGELWVGATLVDRFDVP
jgi:hypothetical protein